jgi:ubiquinone/menaquinone biosynthesis C-methylase UbiE
MARQAPGLHVTGIDLSEKMLADARQSAQQAGLDEQVDFRLGNVEEIPFPDQSLPFYLLIWFATQFIVPAALHRFNEPVGSRNASYTVHELVDLQ